MKNAILALLVLALLSTATAQPGMVWKERLPAFERDLTAMLPDNEPGAAVIITHGREIIFEKYFGLADLEKGEKLTAGHRLGIASMAKQFTGMALLFLIQEGRVRLDDDISKYFPELPLGGRKISVKQLMAHCSGLPELTQNDVFMKGIDRPRTVHQIIAIGLAGPFRSAPGEKYIYCNTGYTIITALVEKLSGMKFAEFLRKKIFEPLKMDHTFECDFDTDAGDAVPRYACTDSGFEKAEKMHFSNLIGGGGVISNAGDLAKWGMALISGDRLPANYRLLWQPILLNSGVSTEYGLGMGISDFEGKTFYYHPGMGSGMNSLNMIFPDDRLSITVIRNVSKPTHTSKDIAFLAAKYLLAVENDH